MQQRSPASNSPPRSHLIAEEFVQVSQLFGVGDLAVQRHVPLHHPRGPADSNGWVSMNSPTVRVRHVVGMWSVAGQGDCSQTREMWHY